MESRLAHGADWEGHRERCRELAKESFRPLGIAVVPDGAGLTVRAASVWQRPNSLPSPSVQRDRRVAQAAVALLMLGDEEPVWPLLRRSADPGIRSSFLCLIRPLGVEIRPLLSRYLVEADVSARFALIQALGEYPPGQLRENERAEFLRSVARQYRDEPDPGFHSGLGSLLDRWGARDERRALDRSAATGPTPRREWYTSGEGINFAIVRGPVEFTMGHQTDLRAEDQDAHPHRVRIDRTFAIGTREVTVAQFERFLLDHPEAAGNLARGGYRRFSPTPDCPMTGIDWFQAAKFCRWLDEQEHIPDDQSPYPSIDRIEEGMILPEGYLGRNGHRLPTEAEWEYASRGGVGSRESYGRWDGDRSPPELLRRHAWCLANAENRTHPVGELSPNDFGLFDTLGNVQEWCGDRMKSYCEGRCHVAREEVGESLPISPRVNRVLRGSFFANPLPSLRVGARSWDWPIMPGGPNGLRVARTMSASPQPAPR